MSKKYVPSFIKEQQSSNTPSNTQSNTSDGSWLTQRNSIANTTNKFEALSDNFSMKKDKPIINTSLPAKEALKLTPATLASITSNGKGVVAPSGSSGTGSKMSFASKFAEQVKIASNPNYVRPPKLVDVNSVDEFPSLGAPKKPTTIIQPTTKKLEKLEEMEKPELVEKPVTISFAEKAREWAKQKEDEEKRAQLELLRQEQLRSEARLLTTGPLIHFRRNKPGYYQDDDDDEDKQYDESSLGESDSYEVREEDEQPSEEENEEDNNEFNQNVGWDGRRKGDLY